MNCPVWETLYEGTRGPGKTDAMLMKFAQHVGRGYGPNWRGVIFRKKYKNLDDLIAKSKRWFFQIFPGARFLSSKSDYKWVFPDGEELLLRAFGHPDDYWDYHGHEYPFIGWEELTSWLDDECYEVMKSCSRSSFPGMPRLYPSNTNPYGPGHNWVKGYFIDPMPRGTVKFDHEGNPRVAIHGDMFENTHLMEADPTYVSKIKADKNENRRKAWLLGDWNIAIGGFFEDCWDEDRNIVKPFMPDIEWPRWRAMDWGYAAPYSVGWYTIDHDSVIYRYRELYGYGGKANKGTREEAADVAQNILDLESYERKSGCKFKRNPADTNIWSLDGREKAINDFFLAKKIYWIKVLKGKGSRVNGAHELSQALKNGTFKVTEDCHHWLRTVPVLMPDEDDEEDVDTDMEDHAYDETRYSLVSRHRPKIITKPPPAAHPHSFDAITRSTKPKRSRYRL